MSQQLSKHTHWIKYQSTYIFELTIDAMVFSWIIKTNFIFRQKLKESNLNKKNAANSRVCVRNRVVQTISTFFSYTKGRICRIYFLKDKMKSISKLLVVSRVKDSVLVCLFVSRVGWVPGLAPVPPFAWRTCSYCSCLYMSVYVFLFRFVFASIFKMSDHFA